MSDVVPPQRFETDRQRIIRVLETGEPRTVPDLSTEAGISQATVAEILDGLRAGGVRLTVHPAHCLGCGFRFEKRDRSKRPGRCPRCRSNRIGRARFHLS